MNKNGNLSVFFLIAISLLLVSCASPKTGLIASNETKQKYHAAEVEQFLETLADKDSPGFSYLISKDGRVITKGGVGFADVENKRSNDASTIFKAGSITKQFTAVSILLLAEQGKLRLDDKLEMYFPELPNAKKTSIRNLLDHTSGMWGQEKDEDFPFPIETEVPVSVHLSYIQKNKPYFEPGEKWNQLKKLLKCCTSLECFSDSRVTPSSAMFAAVRAFVTPIRCCALRWSLVSSHH